MVKVLIVGGTGFIGSYVTRQLLERDCDVTVFHRGTRLIDPALRVTEILGERHELFRFREVFRRVRPEVVVDMIAMCEADAQDLIETFTGIAQRLVVISSADVYRNYELLRGIEVAEPDFRPMSEDAPLRANLYPYRAAAKDENDWVFNYDKILVERCVMTASDLPAMVLRLPVVYGPGDHKHRLFPYVKRMDDGRPAILLEQGQVGWRWTRGYVENVADAICCLVGDQRSTERIYNVGDRKALTESDWIAAIAAEVGWNGYIAAVQPSQLPESMRSGLSWEHQLETDTALIRNYLGFSENVSFREGLARTIAWERTNPPAQSRPEDFDYSSEDAVLAALVR
jgi:nucleoside-diphosphate-sugar epimerase